MAQDISYFQETVQELITPAEYDEMGELVSPAVYQDVIVDRARPQQVTLEDVKRVAHKHKGKKPELVDKFLELYGETVQWSWYDKYKEYLLDKEAVELYNSSREPYTDEEGTEVLPDPKPLPEEPVRPPVRDVATLKSQVLPDIGKIEGVEFEGVLCSATAEDMWGLASIKDWVKLGNSTKFVFDNGNTLVLTPENITAFEAVWIPYRQSFFQ